jgi:hypothetical protein
MDRKETFADLRVARCAKKQQTKTALNMDTEDVPGNNGRQVEVMSDRGLGKDVMIAFVATK